MSKILMIFNENALPFMMRNGTSVYLSALINAMQKEEGEVNLITIDFDAYIWSKYLQLPDSTDNEQAIKDILAAKKISFFPINQKDWKFKQGKFEPKNNPYFGSSRLVQKIEELIKFIKPDIIFAWSAYCLSAINKDKFNKIPVVGIVTDLDFYVRHYRMQFVKEKWSLRYFYKLVSRKMRGPKRKRVELDILRHTDYLICHANHHYKWLRNRGIKKAGYWPILVEDPHITEKYAEIKKAFPPRFLLIGHVNGIATLSGLEFFVSKMLPTLKKLAHKHTFEVHIIGDGKIRTDLDKEMAQVSWIKKRGYVHNIKDEFLTCTALLVPTPIPLGFRTRIAEAFSLGCCVICHSSNALGMSELENNFNVLMEDSGPSLARMAVDLIAAPDLRTMLKRNARQTYIDKLSATNTASDMVKTVFRELGFH